MISLRPRAFALLLLLIAAPAAAQAGAGGADTLRLTGLSAPVEILRDPWGIAHIYAQNEEDLFFAQGYNAARDRLFQFEIWRRQATGTTAEIFGRRELKRDIGARLHRFRGDLSRELQHYHPRGPAIVGAFVAGVNAYVAETERDPSLLPLEFSLLGITPGRWTPEVVISRHQGLLGNIGQELSTGRAVAVLGAEKVKDLSGFGPFEPELALDPAVDGALLGADILELYDAFRAPMRFHPEDVVAGRRGDPEAFARLAAALPGESESELMAQGESIGSNNWVVSGALTSSGLPILANDPHRAQQAPSLRYFVHLVAPGWNVVGGGEPVLPGVSIGHNEHGAWGLTVFGVDGEDLYVYETDAAYPDNYVYQGQWEEMTIERETIPVKGEDPVTVQLRYTRHGPVLYQDSAHNRAYALRAAWMDYGGAPYLASLRMDQASTWEEFREACSYSHIPGENMIWADTAGNIGWQAVGVSPIRPNWSGLVPVPGDGRYEWDGYLPIRELPHVLNPEQGFWVTANNDLVPRDYPHPRAVGFSWSDPFRHDRIEEVLASGRRFTMMDMMRLQQDELSIPARTLVPLLAELEFDDPRARWAAETLLDWDFVLRAESVAAGVYVAWEGRVQDAVYDLSVPPEGREHISRLPLRRTLDWVLAPDARFGADPVRGRDSLLATALREAVEDLTEKLGPEVDEWRYGQERYKHVLLRHPLSPAVDDETRARLDVGPLPRGGYGNTVNATGGSDNQTHGASFRIIADVESWDESLGTHAPGQSGDPESPHYADLFEPWASGRYFPLMYSREKVESVAESRQVLAPGGAR